MPDQHIEMTQLFDAPVETIFEILTDPESFGHLVNAKIKRVVDGPSENKNGIGSVKRIKTFLVPAFEETVIIFEPNKLIEYVISKGSPIKNHKGRMEFSQEQGSTRLKYTIDFEPKSPFLFFGSILKKAIEKPIKKGLVKLANKYNLR